MQLLNLLKRGIAALGVGCLVAVVDAKAAEPEPAAPQVPEIPVASESPDQLPATSDFEWELVGDIQGDGLLATSANDYDRALLRRARLGTILDWKFDWRLRASGDLGEFSGLRDLSVEYRGFPVYIAFGRMIEPFGLLQGSSSGAAFMERPQPMMLAPGYGEGIAANAAGDLCGFSVGTFKATQNDVDLGRRKEDAYTTRLTCAPFLRDSMVLHFGLAVSRRDSGDGFQAFDTIPESTLVHGVDTRSGVFQVDSSSPGNNVYWLYGGELAFRRESLLVQSEYVLATFEHVNTQGPGGKLVAVTPPRYVGYYVEASWAVTGEQRDYSVRRGVFGNIYPRGIASAGGLGSIELAARYSNTDLRYDLPYHGPFGDQGWAAAFGLNWYPNDSLKAMLDGVQIGRLSENGQGVSEQTRQWLIQARVQWYFRWP